MTRRRWQGSLFAGCWRISGYRKREGMFGRRGSRTGAEWRRFSLLEFWQFEELAWCQDTDSFIGPHYEQVFIARMNNACSCKHSAFKDHIVFRIAANALKSAGDLNHGGFERVFCERFIDRRF